jgi:ribosomal protein S18 acetylase RimI-like enzyme
MEKLYACYQKYIKQTHYVPLTFDQFGDMLTKLDYITSKSGDEIEGLLVYGITDFIEINLILGKESSFKPLLSMLLEKTTKSIRIHYQKPYPLPWYVQHQMIHPNAQGIIYNSNLHKVLLSLGFKDTSIQDTYYLDLKQFKMERTITERLESLNFQGYDVSLYNPTKHQGMYAFLEELQSKSFKAAVKKTIEKPKSDPLLVVTKDNQVMGFAGPLIISDDFRGVFSGIELVGDVRGLGLGKILFFTLCKTFQQMGAKYMSLFTGRNNAARFIYLNAGFKIAESFALMLYDRTEQNK